jgi:hypothetical protein
MFNTAGSISSFGKTRPPLAPPDTAPRPLEGAGATAGAGAGAALISALASSTAASTFFSASAAAFFASSAGGRDYAKEVNVRFDYHGKHTLDFQTLIYCTNLSLGRPYPQQPSRLLPFSLLQQPLNRFKQSNCVELRFYLFQDSQA